MSWSIQDSAELYGLPYWGKHLYKINRDGHLVITPREADQGEVDLHRLTEELLERGIELPVLLRMPQIAERRIQLMHQVFAAATEENDYQGPYRSVYPIKVNQQRQLVEEIVRSGQGLRVGLEAGSKPELLICMALLDRPDGIIICNGYKDRRYVEAALLANKLGRKTILVVERPSEVELILRVADGMKVRPRLGLRAKLSKAGKGRWQASSGDRAKFGLSAIDITEMVEKLTSAGKLDCLELLHFHIGSQVTSIGTYKTALREASRLYIELVRLGAPMGTLDVGGGIGVDYDGSRTVFDSSRNYTDSEYAAAIISHVGQVCTQAGVAHPEIVTESGRATVAHCSVLLFEVLGVESLPTEVPPAPPAEDDPDLLLELREVFEYLNERTYQEAWHDAVDVRQRSREAFWQGQLGLQALARIDRFFWTFCGRLRHITRSLSYVPDELDGLEVALADTYYGNFSVFQSAPDAWAVDQLFPCLPIHRLDREPTRRGIIADLTCDSDGKLARFVDRRDVKKVLELHPFQDGERYVLALALIGAYQEILGDMHNLFGDTHAVHLHVDENGEPHIDRVIEGDTVASVTSYVQYEKRNLLDRIRRATELAIREGRIERRDAACIVSFFRESFDGYTYLGH